MSVIFSVIIPSYNIAEYLQRCLDSILAQTFKEYEVIIVNDGSTDATAKIADFYAKKDARISVIHKENEGVSIARNTGILFASGEYFMFFDGDDFVEANCLEELYKIAKEKEVDTIIYGYHRFENNQIKETCYPVFKEGIYEGEEIRYTLLPRFLGISENSLNAWIKGDKKALYVENPALWRTMVNADIIYKNHLQFNKNLKVGEDTIFISEYLSYAKRCYVYQKCFYYLVARETSTIYLYERNPVDKLLGKIKLLEARKELTERIESRCQYDIAKYWRGTVIMSAIELAFLFAKTSKEHGFYKRYQLFHSYLKNEEVKQIIRSFQIKITGSLRLIPFLLLKGRLYYILYLFAGILQITHYEFKR